MVHLPQELDHSPDEPTAVVVRHRATAHHTYVRVVAKEEDHLLDDVPCDVQIGTADHGDLCPRIADLQVRVDGGDLARPALLDMNVHPRSAAAHVAGQVRGVVRASARDDHDLYDPDDPRLLFEEGVEQPADVRRFVVRRDDDGDVHGSVEGGFAAARPADVRVRAT